MAEQKAEKPKAEKEKKDSRGGQAKKKTDKAKTNYHQSAINSKARDKRKARNIARNKVRKLRPGEEGYVSLKKEDQPNKTEIKTGKLTVRQLKKLHDSHRSKTVKSMIRRIRKENK